MTAHTDLDIRTQAKNGIDRADDITVKMILALLTVKEKEIKTDSDFENEIQRRVTEYESGIAIPIALDELEQRVRNKFNNRIQ